MKKYIIKNCENYDNTIWQEPTCNKYPCDCQTKTDCLLKQIVEKCKDAQKTQWVKNKKKPYSPSKAAFAREILKLLEIEEIND